MSQLIAGRATVAFTGAIRFLLESASGEAGQEPCCWWRDFDLFGVESDLWVTAYTGAALARSGTLEGMAAARAAWSALELRSAPQKPGFGYETRATRDADSTTWACRLAQAIGAESSPAASRATDFLAECVCPDGGVRTYRDEAEVRESIAFSTEMSAQGWLRSHTCVTAAAAVLPGVGPSAREYLRVAQSPTGWWESYWWADREYATANAVEALAMSGDGADAHRIARAVEALRGEGERGSPFALALRVLALAGRADYDAPLARLLSFQLPDGSWPASARLRLPAPWIGDPSQYWFWDPNHRSFGCVLSDSRRIFGTATALRALTALRQA